MMFIDLFNHIFKLKEPDAMLLFNHDGFDKTKKIFTNPVHKRTENYITGRFG